MFRVNNQIAAKGAMYSLKSLAWSSYLPYYRQSILRSGIVEEVQVIGQESILTFSSVVYNAILGMPKGVFTFP